MILRRIRIGNQDRWTCGRRDLEDRAPGAGEHEVAGSEGVGEPGLVGEQRVAVGVGAVREAVANLLVVAVAADMEDVEVTVGRAGPGEGLDRTAVD